MEKIIEKLKEKLKSNLITLAEYGKEEKKYVMILEKLDSTTLKEIKPIIQNRKYPLLLTKEELTNGLDVFPLEFLNMKLNHHILYGENIFEKLKFEKNHIRRELEFEFRSKLINLRQGYLETKSNKELKIIVEKAVPTLLPILNGLLYIKNIKIPGSPDEIFNLIEEKYKVNINILKKIDDDQEGNLEEAIEKLITLLSELEKILDKIKV